MNRMQLIRMLGFFEGTDILVHLQAETGGEDAFFVSSKGHGAFGVADGVGAWAEEGVDPSKYPTQFMDAAAQMLGRSANSKVPRVLDVLAHAHGKVIRAVCAIPCCGILHWFFSK